MQTAAGPQNIGVHIWMQFDWRKHCQLKHGSGCASSVVPQIFHQPKQYGDCDYSWIMEQSTCPISVHQGTGTSAVKYGTTQYFTGKLVTAEYITQYNYRNNDMPWPPSQRDFGGDALSAQEHLSFFLVKSESW